MKTRTGGTTRETREMKVSLWHALSARMVWVAVCALGVMGASSVRAETDKVTLANKQVKAGRITKDDKDGLEIELSDGKGGGGARQTFMSADIADVDWDSTADGFHEGVTAFRRGAYTSASENFLSIIDTKETLDQVRPVARPYVYFMLAESKYRGGKLGEATAAYQKLIATFPNSRYVAFALTNMIDAAIQSKAFDKVPALLNTLRDGGNDQKQLADLYEGESLTAQSKLPEAAKKYANAASGPVARVKAMALIGQARCVIATDASKARELAQSALTLTPPETVAATAHNILGDVLISDAESKKLSGAALQDALLDAVLEYMRVQNQYPTDAKTEGYAIFKASDCFLRLAKLPGRTSGDDQSRAVTLLQRLALERRFATTEFPNKAIKVLDELK